VGRRVKGEGGSNRKGESRKRERDESEGEMKKETMGQISARRTPDSREIRGQKHTTVHLELRRADWAAT